MNCLKIILVLLLALTTSLSARQMRDYLPSNALVFDVGAHNGNKSAHYLHLGASRVVCIEPQVSCMQTLREKFKGYPRVFFELCALSDHIGVIPFYECSATTISTADLDWQKGRFSDFSWADPIDAPATTLDALIRKYGVPGFCKIDVEGYELQVLRGMTTPIPYLSFEFTTEFLQIKTKACLEYLSSLGYTLFNVVFGESEEFTFDNWMDWPVLLEEIQKNPDPLYWGDIYARFP